VAWDAFLGQAKQAFERVPSCRHFITVNQTPSDTTAPEGTLSMNAVISSAEPVGDPAGTMPDDTAVILYTSGTTGRPKGAELTHFNLYCNAEHTARKLVHIDSSTVALCVLPLFHSFGQTVVQNATLLAGGTIVLVPRFEPRAAFEAMEKHRVTLFAGVPTMYFALLHFEDSARYDPRSDLRGVRARQPLPWA